MAKKAATKKTTKKNTAKKATKKATKKTVAKKTPAKKKTAAVVETGPKAEVGSRNLRDLLNDKHGIGDMTVTLNEDGGAVVKVKGHGPITVKKAKTASDAKRAAWTVLGIEKKVITTKSKIRW